MFKILSSSIVIIAFLSACNSKPANQNNNTASNIFPYEAFTILDANKEGLSRTGDGWCMYNKDTIAFIDETGKVFNKNKVLIASVNNQTLIDTLGNTIATLFDDGSFEFEKIKASWNSDGFMLRQNNISDFKLEPNNKKTQKSAGLLFSIYSNFALELMMDNTDSNQLGTLEDISLEDLEKELNQAN